MSMSKQNTVELFILDKSFKLHCAPEDEALLKAAAKSLTERLMDLQRRVPSDKLFMMAALQLNVELLSKTQGVESLENDLKALRKVISELNCE